MERIPKKEKKKKGVVDGWAGVQYPLGVHANATDWTDRELSKKSVGWPSALQTTEKGARTKSRPVHIGCGRGRRLHNFAPPPNKRN